MLSERKQIIIKHLVEAYIRNGDPIGSETLLKKSPLECSAATIRSDLVTLEKEGLIQSTHQSSGRIPTVRGYRLFIDNYLTRKPLTMDEEEALKKVILKNQDKKNLLNAASEVLSNTTDLAAVVSPINLNKKIFKHIELYKLSSNKILAVLITNNDDVENRIFDIDMGISEEKLKSLKNYMNEHFAGVPVTEIPSFLKESMTAIRDEINALLKILTEFVISDESECIINGQSKLIVNNDLSNIQKIKKLIELFEKKKTLAYLLNKCIKTDGIKIFIGHESGEKLLNDCSLIAAPYMQENRVVGVLGVIGPHRINYQKIMEIVDFTAKIMSENDEK